MKMQFPFADELLKLIRLIDEFYIAVTYTYHESSLVMGRQIEEGGGLTICGIHYVFYDGLWFEVLGVHYGETSLKHCSNLSFVCVVFYFSLLS